MRLPRGHPSGTARQLPKVPAGPAPGSAPRTAALETRIAQEKRLLLVDMLDNVKKWRQAKLDFAAVTDLYAQPGRHPADAQTLAAGDPRRQQAQGFTQFYRDEAVACAAILTALHMGEKR